MSYQVVDGCFSQTLIGSYKEDIASFREHYIELQDFAGTVLGEKLSVTWKVHCVACHLEQFLDKAQCGLARYAEQTSESAHAALKPNEKRFLVAEDTPNHGDGLKKVASTFSGFRV